MNITPAQTPLADHTAKLSALQVAAFSGASYRMLDYYARIGALVPTVAARGSGSQRRYTAHEARIAWAIRTGQDISASRASGFAEAIGGALRHLPADQWAGMLVVGSGAPLIVEHALALLDALAELGPAALIIDLDACPDPLASETEP